MNTPTIQLASSLDQALSGEITYLPDEEYRSYHANYFAAMDELPAPDVAITREQLAGLKHVVGQHSAPYADFAIFGPHGIRFAKRSKLSGKIIDADGVLQGVETYSPSTVTMWCGSYDVLTTGLLMLRVVSRPKLAKYRKHILRLAGL